MMNTPIFNRLPLLRFFLLAIGFFLLCDHCLSQNSKVKPILTELPDKTNRSFDDVKHIDDLFDLPEAWGYVPDKPKSAKPFKRDVTIALPRYTNSLSFAGANSNIGALLEKRPSSNAGGSSNIGLTFQRFKLPSGRTAPTLDLIEVVRKKDGKLIETGVNLRSNSMKSIGTKGDVALIQNGDRLDLWSVTGKGKHIAGWKPFGQTQPGEGIQDAIAHSAESVFTLSNSGQFYRWKLPECRAIYKRNFGPNVTSFSWKGLGQGLSPGYSPNLKHMAIWSGNNIILVELETGKSLGVLTAINNPGFMRPSFSPDGLKLAVTEVENYTQILVVYDLLTGGTELRMPLPHGVFEPPNSTFISNGGFTWVNQDHGVVSNQLLVDLKAQKPVWKFDATQKGRTPSNFSTPGYGFWFYQFERSAFLRGIKLPHEVALKNAKNTPDIFVARPGSSVSVSMDLDQAPKEIGASLAKAFSGRIETNRMKIVKGENCVFGLTAKVADTGKQIQIESLTPSRMGRMKRKKVESIEVKPIEITVTISLDGREIWSETEAFLPRDGELWEPDPNKTSEEIVFERQWARVGKLAPKSLFAKIPRYVADPELRLKFPSGPYPTPSD